MPERTSPLSTRTKHFETSSTHIATSRTPALSLRPFRQVAAACWHSTAGTPPTSFGLKLSGRLFALSMALLLPAAHAQTASSLAPETTTPAAAHTPNQTPTTPPIRDFIRDSWDTLSRSMTECKSLRDPKVTTAPILYLPAGMAVPSAVAKLHAECRVEVQSLPKPIAQLGDLRPEQLKRPGLLYLPNRYVVPGGRFNEMYGWDSYFIVLGLLSDNRTELARGMAENFFFEIQNYGALLNANRTYFLTRSQPPLLADMIREIHEQDLRNAKDPHLQTTANTAPNTAPTAFALSPASVTNLKPNLWLQHAYTVAQKDYALWTSPIHQAGTTGLARYFDIGEGPVLEMADDSSYYPDAIKYLLDHSNVVTSVGPPDPAQLSIAKDAKSYLVPASAGDQASCDQTLTHVCKSAEVNGIRLSRDFYRGDRAMRESGFDTSFRFGAFSGSTHHFAPVCLNSLLYRYEEDMAGFATELGRKSEAKQWRDRAAHRKAAIQRYLWDPAQSRFVDYDFTTGTHSHYLYVSEFYPLWAGIATPQQAAATALTLHSLELEHGLAQSDRRTGMQWDAPFGWAPNEYFAILGLRRYNFTADADRLAQKFRTDVETNYLRDQTIREKYNMQDGTTSAQQVTIGYKSNGIGFGWTNGVYLRLLPTP